MSGKLGTGLGVRTLGERAGCHIGSKTARTPLLLKGCGWAQAAGLGVD